MRSGWDLHPCTLFCRQFSSCSSTRPDLWKKGGRLSKNSNSFPIAKVAARPFSRCSLSARPAAAGLALVFFA